MWGKLQPLSFLILFFTVPSLVLATGATKITITTEGFIPAYLTIQQGEQVTFKNTDQLPHWPASDIHPTHQIYPEFDPNQPIEIGQEWSFNFDRAGTFKFHDHLHPDLVGEITVQGDESSRQIKIAPSLQEKLRIWGYRLYFRLLPEAKQYQLNQTNLIKLVDDLPKLQFWLQVIGPSQVMDKLLKDSGGGSKIDCHQEAHKIGRAAYQIYQAKTFRKGSSDCHSGFYHGAMESFLNEQGTNNLA